MFYLKGLIYSLLLWLMCQSAAHAHLLNMTQVSMSIDPSRQVRIELEVDMSRVLGSFQAYYEFSRLNRQQLWGDENAELWQRLVQSIELSSDGELVPLQIQSIQPPVEYALEDFEDPLIWPRTKLVLTGVVPGDEVQMRFATAFRFEEPIALNMLDVTSGKSKSRWLVANQSSPKLLLSETLDPALSGPDYAEVGQEFISYLKAGFQHIFPLGLDHMLFIAGLFFAAKSNRKLVLQISLFTLAHSITLIASAYGVVEVPQKPVEVLIALSIFWVAGLNLLLKEPGLPGAGVIFLFGLLHGLGFAAALREMHMPVSNYLVALLSFNLGVEVAQICLVLLLLGLVYLLRPVFMRETLGRLVSIPTVMIAVYWVVVRLL